MINENNERDYSSEPVSNKNEDKLPKRPVGIRKKLGTRPNGVRKSTDTPRKNDTRKS